MAAQITGLPFIFFVSLTDCHSEAGRCQCDGPCSIHIWGFHSRRRDQQLPAINTMASVYDKRLTTASSDSTVKINGVSASSHQPLATLAGHHGPVWQGAWAHPNFGKHLATCGHDGRVIIRKEGSSPDSCRATLSTLSSPMIESRPPPLATHKNLVSL